MNKTIVYFTFGGNCREAMEFYQSCFGGELHFQTVGDTPGSDSLPCHMKACILHAILNKEGLMLMGTDMVADDGLIRGNSISVLLLCDTEADLISIYGKLGIHGKATHPVRRRGNGGLFGGLTDKYGFHWLLRFEKEAYRSSITGLGLAAFYEN